MSCAVQTVNSTGGNATRTMRPSILRRSDRGYATGTQSTRRYLRPSKCQILFTIAPLRVKLLRTLSAYPAYQRNVCPRFSKLAHSVDGFAAHFSESVLLFVVAICCHGEL